MPRISAYKSNNNKKKKKKKKVGGWGRGGANTIINISRYVFAVHLFFSLEYAQFWGFGGACVCLTISRFCRVGFCSALCVFLALNYQAIQSKVCISAAKYEHLSFFEKLC